MIRVAFVVAFASTDWMGGVTYFSNLVRAVMSLPNRKIDPVLIVAPTTPRDVIEKFPKVEIVSTNVFGGRNFHNLARKIVRSGTGRDLLVERFLKANDISVQSHYHDLGPGSRIPTICWIADFQHTRLPHLYSEEERRRRDVRFEGYCKNSTLLVLSSGDAQRDLSDFCPAALPKSRLLRFVAGIDRRGAAEVSLDALRAKYGFDGPYFHLPNQFWAHKNHKLVVDALARLKERGKPPLVLATGSTFEYRQPDFYDNLMRHVSQSGLANSFRSLGLVPFADLEGLMRHSAAVINPSLFEGWSTTVEEAKSMGKTVLLSDIPIHREQAPEWGAYFDPRDPDSLAQSLQTTLERYALDVDKQRQAEAARKLPGRIEEFGRTYQEIALEAVHRGNSSQLD